MGIQEKDLIVEYGIYKSRLSLNFLKSRNAVNNLDVIKDLFHNKFKLYTEMNLTDDKKALKQLADKVWENEKSIMQNFNFPVNADFFRFWEMPKCSCPKMDNQDSWGTKIHYYSGDCPIHS